MTQDEVLFGYGLQLFALAVERSGLEMLRPGERQRPVMPNQLSLPVE